MEKVEEAQKWGHWAIRGEENGPPPPPQLPLIFGVREIGRKHRERVSAIAPISMRWPGMGKKRKHHHHRKREKAEEAMK
jgi:hypothetical protein